MIKTLKHAQHWQNAAKIKSAAAAAVVGGLILFGCSPSSGGGSTTPPATGGDGTSTTPPATATTPPTTATTTPPSSTTTPPTTTPPPPAGNHVQEVFVIAMENEPAAAIYGSSAAPYINGQLIPKYAHAMAFSDPLPDSIPSEPHYVWMEAGTNAFSDTTFTGDGDPTAGNSTASTAHLTAQMKAASPQVTWLGFMEGASAGTCPVGSTGFYAAKHDPFVFFQDVVGNPPSQSSAECVAHHRPYTTASFAQALSQGDVAQYNFISPNVCNDMHGGGGCPSGNVITLGDQWLQANLPPLIDYVNAHEGVIFVIWDEPEGGSNLVPFLAIGPHVKPNYSSSVAFTHSSLPKTIETIFKLPVLPTLTSANDFADVFQPGFYP